MVINRKIDELAMSWDGGDKYGSTMAWAFGCADALYLAGEEVPDDWQYVPGAAGPDPNQFEVEGIAAAVSYGDVDWREVRKLGDALLRYRDILKARGEAY